MYSAKILWKDSRHFSPFSFIYCFQFANVCIKHPHLATPTKVICTSPFVLLTENLSMHSLLHDFTLTVENGKAEEQSEIVKG